MPAVLVNTVMSSAYARSFNFWFVFILLFLRIGWRSGSIPRMKRRAESGQPCLIPFSILMKLESWSLTSMNALVSLYKLSIVFVSMRGQPISFNNFKKKHLPSLSNALLKSKEIMQFNQPNFSLARRASKIAVLILRFGRYANWCLYIRVFNGFLSPDARTF